MVQAEWVVVFIRHGHSEWNLTHRFTGWTDIELTEVGIGEAAAAGRRLAEEGFAFDEAHVSVLRRTRQTVEALLAGAAHPEVPIHATWRLNERHYGALQGLNKHEIFAAWGETQSRRWWRGYHEPPPALAHDDPRHPRFSPLYRDLHPAHLPATESLRDCQRRTLPYWREVLAPRVAAGRRLLVASHGNTLRGLIMHLEAISPEAMEHVEVPSGVPLVFRFARDMTVLGREWLE
ncbi:MAG: 2,3-bisphosphoglycerate-dependent phosphoglycerate mutase [Thiobacillaceae bacterium]|jgi:2,3-bisphosphoglycerate-dependent phosphoglycerate mutase|nr:2,3-bisphosphoglycerate-dependent phosphoglycerate mutase [Thiobacillaceae bacterium]